MTEGLPHTQLSLGDPPYLHKSDRGLGPQVAEAHLSHKNGLRKGLHWLEGIQLLKQLAYRILCGE